MAESTRVLACVCPSAASSPSSFEPTTSASTLGEHGVQILIHPTLQEFQQAVDHHRPQLLYLGAPASYDQDPKQGTLRAFVFKGSSQPAESVLVGLLAGKGVATLYLDAHADFSQVQQLQSRGDVTSIIAWSPIGGAPASAGPPATVAAHFSRTFLSVLLSHATPNEAYAMAFQVVQALFSSAAPPPADGSPAPPPHLPSFLSPLKPELPDSNSIPEPAIPGLDHTLTMAANVPGWSDLRLLAPRAELRLLLCGGSGIIDSARLTLLGEGLRALLVMETRCLQLVGTTPGNKVPCNLAPGCQAVRCEIRTATGRTATVVLGGPPALLKETKLVEHALRMTLVADAQSLQFRLPPPGTPVPAPRASPAVAGGAPVMDAVCMTSVWVVQVLRALCQDRTSTSLITMGIAAVGATATAGLTATDAQRLKLLVYGAGPSEHPLMALPPELAEAKPRAAAAPSQPGQEEGAEAGKVGGLGGVKEEDDEETEDDATMDVDAGARDQAAAAPGATGGMESEP